MVDQGVSSEADSGYGAGVTDCGTCTWLQSPNPTTPSPPGAPATHVLCSGYAVCSKERCLERERSLPQGDRGLERHAPRATVNSDCGERTLCIR